jgi:hypothetical protein
MLLHVGQHQASKTFENMQMSILFTQHNAIVVQEYLI